VGEGVGPASAEGLVVEVKTSALTAETDEVYFTLSGDGLRKEPIGGWGSIDAGTNEATIRFRRVPEGRKFVEAWGLAYDSVGALGMHWILSESGNRGIQLVGNSSNLATAVMSPRNRTAGGGLYQLGLDASGDGLFGLNGDYSFDADHRWAGSPDGSNMRRICYDGAPTVPAEGGNPAFTIFQGAGGCGLGLFASEPEAPWQQPDQWLGRADVEVTADNPAGPYCVHVVAPPGHTGADCTVFIAGGLGEVYVRLLGLGDIGVAIP